MIVLPYPFASRQETTVPAATIRQGVSGLRADVDAAVKAPKRAARPEIGGDRTTHRQARPQRGNRQVPRADRGVVAGHMPPLRSVITRHAAADSLRGGTTLPGRSAVAHSAPRWPPTRREKRARATWACTLRTVSCDRNKSNWCASTRYRSKVYERSDRARTWGFRQGTSYRLPRRDRPGYFCSSRRAGWRAG